MKSKKILSAALAAIISLSLFVVPASAQSKPDSAKMTADEVFNQQTVDQMCIIIKSKEEVADFKAPKTEKNISASAVSASAASAPADYPTRKGMILITNDYYKGLIPTGHSAIVYSATQVVESVSNGVVMGKNDWWSSKNSSAAGSVNSTTVAQDAAAADWCKGQLGKPYNFNYFNTGTRSSFYCSQLVWASFLDNYSVDLNTSAYSTVLGNPIHPLELLANDLTYISYKYNW
jgi:uncharacterized protein YycO